jgi:hypothetical protein
LGTENAVSIERSERSRKGAGLGYNLGDSPGVPYVLEIWPVGHYSPIQDHGDANAAIKVSVKNTNPYVSSYSLTELETQERKI